MTKKTILLVSILTISTLSLFAQSPPHPNGGNNPNPTTNGTVGSNGPSGAPIDGGVTILLVLAAAYAGTRFTLYHKQ